MTTTVLLTGATGQVGSVLLRRLVDMGGYRVRALIRPGADVRLIEGLPYEMVPGDVTDVATLESAMAGCEQVFHVAGMVSWWAPDRRQVMRINARACEYVRDAALKNGKPRIVLTSSSSTVGFHWDGRPSNEDVPQNPELYALTYPRAKYLGEQVLLRAVATHGLEVVAVNPSGILGPNDLRYHGGKLIRTVKLGQAVIHPSGGASFIDVDDVVEGHIQAMRKGVPGRRYLLSGDNLTFKEAMTETARIVGGKPPLFGVPHLVTVAAAWALAGVSYITRIAPPLTPDLAALADVRYFHDNTRMRTELGVEPMPFERTVERTYRFYVDRGMLP